jgi:hypothetical protein
MGASWRIASRTRSSSCHRLFLLAVRLGPRCRRCAEHFPLARGPIGGLLDIHEAREIGRPCGQLCPQGLPTCHRQTDSRMVEWPADLGSEQDEPSGICEVAHVIVQETTPKFPKKSPVRVSDQTARHDLKTLRSCSTGTRGEHDPQMILPRSRCLRRRRLGRTTGSRVGSRAPHPTCEEAQ